MPRSLRQAWSSARAAANPAEPALATALDEELELDVLLPHAPSKPHAARHASTEPTFRVVFIASTPFSIQVGAHSPPVPPDENNEPTLEP